jgi:hypothetical protein
MATGLADKGNPSLQSHRRDCSTNWFRSNDFVDLVDAHILSLFWHMSVGAADMVLSGRYNRWQNSSRFGYIILASPTSSLLCRKEHDILVMDGPIDMFITMSVECNCCCSSTKATGAT